MSESGFGCTGCTESHFRFIRDGRRSDDRAKSFAPSGDPERCLDTYLRRRCNVLPAGMRPRGRGRPVRTGTVHRRSDHVQDDDRLPRRTQRVGLQPDHQRRGGRGAARRHRARHRRPRPHRRRGAARGTARRARPGGRGPHRRRGRVRAGDRVPHDADCPSSRTSRTAGGTRSAPTGPPSGRSRARTATPRTATYRSWASRTTSRRWPTRSIPRRAGSPSSSVNSARARRSSTTSTCAGYRRSEAAALSAARGSPGCSGKAPASGRSPRRSRSRPTPAWSGRRARAGPGRRPRRRAPCRGSSP